jgi:hypothetical protein
VVKIIVKEMILDHPTMLVIMAGFQVKKQDAVLLALFRDILKTLIIYLMVGHGVNMYGDIIALLPDSELIKGIACGKNQYHLGILLGIRQNQDVLIVVQEKLVIWLQGNVIQEFLVVFIKFVVNQTEPLV